MIYDNINQQANNILLQAADLLEQKDRWTQGDFFKKTENGCAMCAHGAIMYCGNAQTKELADHSPAYAAQNSDSVHVVKLIRLIVDKHRSFLTDDATDRIMVSQKYGAVGLAHYKAMKKGLSFIVNDMVLNKRPVINLLKQAANN